MNLISATRSEVTKITSTSIWWVLATVLFAYVGVSATGIAFFIGGIDSGLISPNTQQMSGAGGIGTLADSAAPYIYSMATAVGYVFPVLIGTLLITGELRHQTLTPTFLAVPRRGLVLWAKVLAGTKMGVFYALTALLATVGGGAAVLAAFGVDTLLSSSDTWAMIGRIVLAFVMWVWVGIGLGLVVRNQVAAVVIVLAFTQFIEPLLRFGAGFVSQLAEIGWYLPGGASDTLVGASIYSLLASSGSTPPEWWVGGIVLAVYAGVLLLIGYISSWRRDVT